MLDAEFDNLPKVYNFRELIRIDTEKFNFPFYNHGCVSLIGLSCPNSLRCLSYVESLLN